MYSRTAGTAKYTAMGTITVRAAIGGGVKGESEPSQLVALATSTAANQARTAAAIQTGVLRDGWDGVVMSDSMGDACRIGVDTPIAP
jgi:hypothetical protein